MSAFAGVIPHDEPPGPAHAESKNTDAKIKYFMVIPVRKKSAENTGW